MMRSGRGPVLLVVAAIAVLVTSGVWWARRSGTPAENTVRQSNPQLPSSGAATPSPPLASAGAAVAPPRTRVRSPLDPLPPPATPAGIAEEQAAALARQLLAGGDAAVPALVAALHLGGFPIRNPDGTVTAPAGRSQGIAFELWEVNALGELFASRKAVTAPLSSVAGALATRLPGVSEAQLSAFLLDGLRAHARDEEGPLVFWSALIVELGRNARTHSSYDLLGDVAPDAVELDLLQIALITKRLAGDLAVLANPDKVKAAATKGLMPFSFPSLIVQPVFAQSPPCGLKEAEATFMDWMSLGTSTVFGKLIEHLGGRGVAGAETASTITAALGVILAYVKVAMTMSAFEIAFELEGSPLVRTKEVRPRSGEKKSIVTTVTLDWGRMQWVNCFRMVLNLAGLDLNADQNGPVEGASVAWNGWAGFKGPWAVGAGPEQLVRFVGDEDSRIQSSGRTSTQHSIIDQRTDKQGKARVDIEGIGQDEFLGSQPREVMKEATASAMVVLKPANIFRDLKDAGTTAMGGIAGVLTMPAELMYRTRWSFGGNFTFPVKDWKAGNGWSGTISYRVIERRFRENQSERICCGGRTQVHEYRSDTEQIIDGSWDIADRAGSEPLSADFSMAKATYTMSASRTHKERSHNTGWASCGGGAHPPTSRTHTVEEVGNADYNGTAEVTIELENDGTFTIGAGSGETPAIGESRIVETNDRNNGCQGAEPTRTQTNTGRYRPGDYPAHISGKADPDAATLSGSLTRVDKHTGAGIITTRIYTWDLRR